MGPGILIGRADRATRRYRWENNAHTQQGHGEGTTKQQLATAGRCRAPSTIGAIRILAQLPHI